MRNLIYEAIAHTFYAGVVVVDKACGIWLNMIDRGGKTGRESHFPLNEDDK